MITLVLVTVLVSLLAAFIILLASKVGFITFLQIHGNKFFSDVAHCELCQSFWVTCVISIILGVSFWNWQLCLITFFATPITRKLL